MKNKVLGRWLSITIIAFLVVFLLGSFLEFNLGYLLLILLIILLVLFALSIIRLNKSGNRAFVIFSIVVFLFSGTYFFSFFQLYAVSLLLVFTTIAAIRLLKTEEVLEINKTVENVPSPEPIKKVSFFEKHLYHIVGLYGIVGILLSDSFAGSGVMQDGEGMMLFSPFGLLAIIQYHLILYFESATRDFPFSFLDSFSNDKYLYILLLYVAGILLFAIFSHFKYRNLAKFFNKEALKIYFIWLVIFNLGVFVSDLIQRSKSFEERVRYCDQGYGYNSKKCAVDFLNVVAKKLDLPCKSNSPKFPFASTEQTSDYACIMSKLKERNIDPFCASGLPDCGYFDTYSRGDLTFFQYLFLDINNKDSGSDTEKSRCQLMLSRGTGSSNGSNPAKEDFRNCLRVAEAEGIINFTPLYSDPKDRLIFNQNPEPHITIDGLWKAFKTYPCDSISKNCSEVIEMMLISRDDPPAYYDALDSDSARIAKVTVHQYSSNKILSPNISATDTKLFDLDGVAITTLRSGNSFFHHFILNNTLVFIDIHIPIKHNSDVVISNELISDKILSKILKNLKPVATFKYIPPSTPSTISSIEPTSGPMGTVISIKGAGLRNIKFRDTQTDFVADIYPDGRGGYGGHIKAYKPISADGKEVMIKIDDKICRDITCTQYLEIVPGKYLIYTESSNPAYFTVTE